VSWLASHWSELVALVTGTAAVVSDAKRRKAKKEAERLAQELQSIREMAGTLGKHER